MKNITLHAYHYEKKVITIAIGIIACLCKGCVRKVLAHIRKTNKLTCDQNRIHIVDNGKHVVTKNVKYYQNA